MMGTFNCTYETPCGWCTKWDKKCDLKIPDPPVINQWDYTTNKICESDSDHQWECCGVSTEGSTYRCKICGKTMFIPYENLNHTTTSVL